MKNRSAFTLIEMMLSITILLLVFGLAIPFFRTQLQAMDSHAGRFDAQQNARFGVTTIERELRVAGAGVPDKQPMIVQADPYAITFNADLVTTSLSNIGGFGAVYYNPDLPVAATISLRNNSKITLPRSATTYPDSNYFNQSGPLSYAETISFWVAEDTTGGNRGTYALYRRVNALPPTIIARGLVLRSKDPKPFRYIVLNDKGEQTDVPENRLPAIHTAIHGSHLDTGRSALTDSIRLVKVFLVGRSINARGDTSYREVEASIRLLNSGLLQHATCGEAPVFGKTVTAAYNATTGEVVLQWNRAIDEEGGEKDVERYIIFRRRQTESAFQEPLTSIPAGENVYVFKDALAGSGSWIYGVAAQDCGGQHSPIAETAVVNVP
jgi:prepilin-type N-terminal cleavage/methylation domain-containing protein